MENTNKSTPIVTMQNRKKGSIPSRSELFDIVETAFVIAGYTVASQYLQRPFKAISCKLDENWRPILLSNFPMVFDLNEGLTEEERKNIEDEQMVAFAVLTTFLKMRGRLKYKIFSYHQSQDVLDIMLGIPYRGENPKRDDYFKGIWLKATHLWESPSGDDTPHWKAVEALAHALLVQNTLIYENVLEIINKEVNNPVNEHISQSRDSVETGCMELGNLNQKEVTANRISSKNIKGGSE